MEKGCCWSLSLTGSFNGVWAPCVRVCFAKPWTRAASPSKLCCLSKGPDGADNGEREDEDDEEESSGMAESLHSTCLSSALPVGGMGAAVTPEVTVISAVVTVTVVVPPSFLALADAWQ